MITIAQQNKLNKILLIIKNIRQMNNYNMLHKELNLLKFGDIIELELNKFAYKLINNMMPEMIKIVFEQERKHFNTGNKYIPRIAPHNSNLYNRSFMSKTISMFTKLPEDIK